MGRKPVAELCIFCGESPCTCPDSKSAKKAPKPRKAAAPKPVEKQVEDPFASTPIPEKKNKFAGVGADIPARDLNAESVLRLIRPLLAEQDQKKVDDLLDHPIPQDIDRLESEWRKRNGLGKFYGPR